MIPFEARDIPTNEPPAVGDRRDEQPEGADDAATDPDGRRLTCRACATVVADERDLLSVTGTGPSVYANPHGRVFEVLTVRHATNVVAVGESTMRFTWFAGYAWRIVLCNRCGSHLGWLYETVEDRSPPRFIGLIRSAVTGPLC